MDGGNNNLTFSTLLIEGSPGNDLGLDDHIDLLFRSNIHDILYGTTIVPWVPTESLPDTEDSSIGRNIDTVGGEDVFAGRADIEQVRLGLSIWTR